MKNEISVVLNGVVIGKVYELSDRWVAQPSWSLYSCSFLSSEEAIIELKFHYQTSQLQSGNHQIQ